MTTGQAQSELGSGGARDWATFQEPHARPLYDAVQERLGIGPGTRLLDVGYGYAIHQADQHDTHTLLRYHKSTSVAMGASALFMVRGWPRWGDRHGLLIDVHASASQVVEGCRRGSELSRSWGGASHLACLVLGAIVLNKIGRERSRSLPR